jgi:hypothetical protein
MLARARVFTFKAGLLSRLAHDLELSVHRFEITLERSQLRAWFAADSLRVEGVVTAAGLDHEALSGRDHEQIVATLRDELLHAERYPRIEFSGTITDRTALRVEGTLSLRGHTQPLSFGVERRGSELLVNIPLTPSQFGISPYKTLGGAIRLQDRVVVTVSVQLAEAEAATILEKNDVTYFRPAD